MLKRLHPDPPVFAAIALLGLWPPFAAAEDTLRLLSGTPVRLELQHHITSAYTPAGSTIWFRVAEDVVAGEGIAVRKGTPVRGRMRSTSDRAMLGASGTMEFRIDFVTAVDGQQVRVVAAESHRGRDRGNALAGWTIFWGLPGLMTRGVHGWLERGAEVEALVLHDKRIAQPESPAAIAAAAPPPAVLGRITGHRFSTRRAGPFRLDFERDKPLGTVEFLIEAPPDMRPGMTEWASLQLVRIDGMPVEEPVAALAASADGARFDSWSILRYCRHGTTTLGFAGSGPGGETLDFEYALQVEFKHRDEGQG